MSNSTIYRSEFAARGQVRTRRAAGLSMVVAAVLVLVGLTAMIAGLTGILGFERIGVIRSIFYMGLGLSGGGAGGLLMIALDNFRHP